MASASGGTQVYPRERMRGEEQRGREGPENEGWGRGFTLQLNQANSSLLPKKGGPHFHLSLIPYLSVLAKQFSPLLHGRSDTSLNLVSRFSSLSQEKTIHFSIFWGKSAFWKLNKLDPCSTRAGTRQGIPQGMATPLRRSSWLDWFSYSTKTHPYPWETAVSPNN